MPSDVNSYWTSMSSGMLTVVVGAAVDVVAGSVAGAVTGEVVEIGAAVDGGRSLDAVEVSEELEQAEAASTKATAREQTVLSRMVTR